MQPQEITIRRAELADAAAHLAAALGEPVEAVEEALWAWVQGSLHILLYDNAIEILTQGGWNQSLFRAALGAWKARNADRRLDLPPSNEGVF